MPFQNVLRETPGSLGYDLDPPLDAVALNPVRLKLGEGLVLRRIDNAFDGALYIEYDDERIAPHQNTRRADC
jgi:hypothetical protein